MTKPGPKNPPPPEGGPSPGLGHRDPRYRGLYLKGRQACEGAAAFRDMYKGGPEDLDTLYPEDLSPALGRLEALKEDSSGKRFKGRRLSPRDLTRLALMESEISSIERRLAMHARRVRGCHLAMAEALGRGWKEYLLGLGRLLFFLEKTASGLLSLRSTAADPGRSSKAVVKGLDDALWLAMENARQLSSRTVPPEDLQGLPLKGAKPPLIYLTRPSRRSKLLDLAQGILNSLERSRLLTLDLLLAAEDRVRELCSRSPKALKAFLSLPPGTFPDVPDAKDPRETAPSPYSDPSAASPYSALSASSPAADPASPSADPSPSVGSAEAPAATEAGLGDADGEASGQKTALEPAGAPSQEPAREPGDAPGHETASEPGGEPVPETGRKREQARETAMPQKPTEPPEVRGLSEATDSLPLASAEAPQAADEAEGRAGLSLLKAPGGAGAEEASGEPQGSGERDTSGPLSGPEAFRDAAPLPAEAASSSSAASSDLREVTHAPQAIPELLRATAAAAADPIPDGEVPPAPAPAWAPPPGKGVPETEAQDPPAPGRKPLRTLLMVCIGLALGLAATVARQALFPSSDVRLYVFNGLGAPLTVKVGSAEDFLAPGDRLEKTVMTGARLRISAFSDTGSPVEDLYALAPAPGRGSLVYSVAGAAPFVEWTARYGPQPLGDAGQRSLGAPRLFSSGADYILSMPPGTLKLMGGSGTRLALNPLAGAHPELMLGLVSEDDKPRLIRVHARWEAPDQTFLPLWLALAAAQDPRGARGLLEERVSDRPGEVWSLRELLRLLPPEDRAPLCLKIGDDSRARPEDADLAYLDALCEPDMKARAARLQGLLARFPGSPFLLRAAGLEAFAAGDTALALERLAKAFAADPRVMLQDTDMLARLSRLGGKSRAEILSEIGPWSPSTRRLSEPEAPEEPSPSDSARLLSLRRLYQGRPADALNAAPEPFRKDMLLWAAASDGAGDELVSAWREYFSPEQLSGLTAWCDWALSVREGKDSSAAESLILEMASEPELARKAFRHILDGDWESLRELSRGLDPWFQGQLALALTVIRQNEAPAEARHVAKSYLYIGERPYLR
ncbi:MAG: hypothetical protein LBW85_13755 [Deltaproteobacteria bacterium]|nr:hypothetical protein [Deltaproteobacteria bacterium]